MYWLSSGQISARKDQRCQSMTRFTVQRQFRENVSSILTRICLTPGVDLKSHFYSPDGLVIARHRRFLPACHQIRLQSSELDIAEFFSKIRKTARSRDLFNRLRRGKKEHVGTRIGYLLAKFQLERINGARV